MQLLNIAYDCIDNTRQRQYSMLPTRFMLYLHVFIYLKHREFLKKYISEKSTFIPLLNFKPISGFHSWFELFTIYTICGCLFKGSAQKLIAV